MIKTPLSILRHLRTSWKLGKSLNCTRCLSTSFRASSYQNEKLSMSYSHVTAPYKLSSKTIGEIVDEAADKYGDKEAVVFFGDNIRMTFAQFKEKVDAFAAGLLSLGLERGDRIGIWGQNHLEWVITMYAAVKAGLILVNVNPAYKSNELEYALNKVQMKALVLMPTFKTTDYLAILHEVVPEITHAKPGQLRAEKAPSLEHVIISEGEGISGAFTVCEISRLGGVKEEQRLTELKKEIQSDDAVNIQFTSGTTGYPKGATLTHHGLVNNAYAVGDILGYNEASNVCVSVPLYHCFGLTLGSLNCMLFGSKQIYPSRGFDAHAVLKTIHHERCTSVYGTPAMFIDMLNQPNFYQYDYTSLRTGVMAGSPCPVEVMRKIIKDMHCSEMTICYGLTETSPVTNQTRRHCSVEVRTSTVGEIIPHIEAKVIDTEGRIVPVNTPGEICFRGFAVMQGYWNDEEKTKEAIDKNGWFLSGDLGVIDENGYCKIVGRLKDMVIRGGENIYPTEIENFLHTHPKIQDVQVVGVTDERMGEELCACIKLKPGENCTEDDIKEFCKGKISHFKIPRYVQFLDEYPMTVTGKVKKMDIRKDMEKLLKGSA